MRRQELLKRHAAHYKSRYSTPTRNSPQAGAVGPARPRSREASTSRICSHRPSPAADLHQRADDGPDHVAEKSVAGDLVDDQRLHHGGLGDAEVRPVCSSVSSASSWWRSRASRRATAMTVRSVVRVVPPAAETPRSRAALRAIAPPPSIASTSSGSDDVPRVVTLERAEDVGVPDPIAVGLRAGVVARVELCGDRVRRQHPDVGGKPRVQRPHQRVGLDRALERKRGDLAQRVHARVGPAGAGDADIAAIELAKRVLDQPLDRRARRLPLPADVVRAVVGEGDLERRHRVHGRSKTCATTAVAQDSSPAVS